MVISKSEYMLFLKHPAWLWLKKYAKSKLPEIDESLQALFDEGNLFEGYAEKLFPQAIKLGYKTGGNFDGNKYNSLPLLTKKEIEKGTPVMFQGRVEIDNITCIFDVLERFDGKTNDLYEIKSSTSVKPEHILDLGFQAVALEKTGLTIRNFFVLYVNNKYVRKGDIDLRQLVEKKDVTEDVRGCIDETLVNIQKAFAVVSMKNMPDVSPRFIKGGSMEEWLAVFELVKGELPENSIYKLFALTTEQVGKLEDLGIETMSDIPDDFGLSERQMAQVMAVKKDQPIIIKSEIANFFRELKYPLYFLDYETFSGVIPAFDNLRPYQQVTFQYSLHMLHRNSEKEVEHKEYLHKTNTNPCETLLKQLREDVGKDGTVLVWHESFEKSRNKELAEMHPEYEAFLLDLNGRIADLKIPFSKGWYVDKGFSGSASLKDVQPVIIHDECYAGLEISNGSVAQQKWMQTFLNGKNTDKKDGIVKDLLEYCRYDTLVMVKIFQFLEGVVSKNEVFKDTLF